MKINEYGYYLNGEKLLKTVKCKDIETAYKKLVFVYPEHFNIKIRLIKKNVPL